MTGLLSTPNRGGFIQIRMHLASPPPEGKTGVRLPLDAFEASGGLLRSVPAPGGLTSVAVVACGRDHDAQIDVRELGFY